MATIKDVAKLAGVSVSTVSIVINNKAEERKISQETCRQVQWAIGQLGYQPNVSARKLRVINQNKPVIALYWPMDLRSKSVGWVLKCLQDAFNAMFFECDLMVCSYQINHLKDEPRLVDSNSFSAVIIGGATTQDLAYLESLTLNIPVVLFSRYSEKYCSVYTNNERTGQAAADLVIRCGYKRVAIASTEADYSTSRKRIQSFLNACKEGGAETKENMIFPTSDSTRGGFEAGMKMAQVIDQIDVIFCQTDSIALGVSHALVKSGIRIPEDVALLSSAFLEPDYMEYANPSITVVFVPIPLLAESCAQLLINLLNHKLTAVVHKELDPIVIERDSCRAMN